jgi:hypothetical protein
METGGLGRRFCFLGARRVPCQGRHRRSEPLKNREDHAVSTDSNHRFGLGRGLRLSYACSNSARIEAAFFR